ncbi:aminotransferase class I/II-fold pyridoxal phosphate-dependent enzyme [Clostridium cylindrosporum]|uniref:Arginine decarboxylase SpeA n=1 Tax=Clostridium cylindrosporum DSM 605 TaxID=1121307 RepID=A0A0J8G372_CLOCY|nr:aminotransferase class I/II-fold pyridoxal phosphate-dependent enzyme [Clostridium cylindrosporum]KMT22151.1 arginine decarboxylase SpeA [Clostridium cylindrosporum DSM 605]
MKEIDQDSTPLFDAVKSYIQDEVIPFHVPGHKHGRGIPELTDFIGEQVLKMDLNGMKDLDFFNNPKGVILDAEKLFAKAFNAKEAFFLVNGTTSGIEVMIMSTCNPGDEIILPRNAHRSAISGIILSGAVPIYVEPEINKELGIANGVSVEKMKEAIATHPNAKAIFLINPTYYGFTSDIKTIAELAHKYNMSVLVDEAHGAHMYFHKDLPSTAMEQGADMCAMSMHKTGGSLTQSSALLVANDRISLERVKKVLDIIFTSSASYLLLCSLDIARKHMALRGNDLLQKTLDMVRWARNEINEIDGIYGFGKELVGSPGCFDFDETKLGINVRRLGFTGYEIEALLRKEYNIQIELADINNILALVSIGDRFEDLKLLINSLKDISSKCEIREYNVINSIPNYSKSLVSPREAFYSEKELLSLKESVGRIVGEMVMAYPPGIPVICEGEIMTKEIIDYINILKSENCELQGTIDPLVNHIQVLS